MQSINPATGEILWEGEPTTEKGIDAAIGRARKAFSLWSRIPLAQRIGLLIGVEEELKSQGEELALTISKEMGKPLWESKLEVQSMIDKVGITMDAYEERTNEKVGHLPQGDLVIRHRPHGVCGVLGPFNFPGHLPQGHVIPALLAGNTIVFKPSEHTPLVGEKLVKIWQDAGLPAGVVNLVQGDGRLLAHHPGLDALFFTGSANVGRLLFSHYGQYPEKLLALEMGGNNSLVVVDPPNLTAAAYTTVLSAFLTSGQRCTAARRLIVVNNEPFIEELKRLIKNITMGPYHEDPFMGPLVSEAAANRVREAAGLQGEGTFVPPTLLERELPDQEIFGPILQLIRVPDFASAIEKANATTYGLAASLLCKERRLYEEFHQSIRAGIINWNQPTIGASGRAPFGGVGCSGNHRPSGYYAVDYCSYPVASIEGSLTLPKNPRIPL